MSISFPTDIHHACARDASRHYGLDVVAVHSPAYDHLAHASVKKQAVATNGHILAVADCHHELGGDLSVQIPRQSMPSKKTNRTVMVAFEDGKPVTASNHKDTHPCGDGRIPPLNDVFPKRDDLVQTATFNVRHLRALLDAVCPVANPDALVTIGLNERQAKPAVVTTQHGIGCIMPHKGGEDQKTRMADLDDHIRRAVDLSLTREGAA